MCSAPVFSHGILPFDLWGLDSNPTTISQKIIHAQIYLAIVILIFKSIVEILRLYNIMDNGSLNQYEDIGYFLNVKSSHTDMQTFW